MTDARRHVRAHRGLVVMAAAAAAVLVLGGATPSWAKELMLKAGDVEVPAGTVVHGDVIAVGGTAYIDGTVEGDAVALGGRVDVRGRVTGSVRAMGGSVMLRSTAVVGGAATALGGSVAREPGASVGGGGAVSPSAPAPPPPAPLPGPPGAEQPPFVWPPGTLAGVFLALKALFLFFHVLVLMAFIGTAWLLAVLFPRGIERLGGVLEHDPLMAFAAGLLAWPIAVVLAVLLAVTLVGLALVPLIPIVVFAAAQFGATAVALLVGRRLRQMELVQEVVVGAVILAVAFSLPGVGGLLAIAAATWGIGAVILLLTPERRLTGSGTGSRPDAGPRPTAAPAPPSPQKSGSPPPQGAGGPPAS